MKLSKISRNSSLSFKVLSKPWKRPSKMAMFIINRPNRNSKLSSWKIDSLKGKFKNRNNKIYS